MRTSVTLTRSKVKVKVTELQSCEKCTFLGLSPPFWHNVKVTGLLNFRQLAKPYMLAAMTAAPLRGFLVLQNVYFITNQFRDVAF